MSALCKFCGNSRAAGAHGPVLCITPYSGTVSRAREEAYLMARRDWPCEWTSFGLGFDAGVAWAGALTSAAGASASPNDPSPTVEKQPDGIAP